MTTSEAVYTTTTGDESIADVRDPDDWCYVCSRPTDHRAEHDDLVEEGKARYDEDFGLVYFNALGLLNV